jgi:prepilin-type N-terminal cleavage/methylation domain-containing protein
MALKTRQTNNQSGTTLIELLVAISIIAIMTGIFMSQVRISDKEQLEIVVERLAADFRQLRNLSASRVIGDDNQYPAGGYGIAFEDYDGVQPSSYVIFADDGQNIGYLAAEDDLISGYTFPETGLTVYPSDVTGNNSFFYTFITEHSATTTIPASGEGFTVAVEDGDIGYRGRVVVSDTAQDGYIWGNIAVIYSEF